MNTNRKRLLDFFESEGTLKFFSRDVVICQYIFTNEGEFSMCKSKDYVNWLKSNTFVLDASSIDYDFKIPDKSNCYNEFF